MLLGVSLLVSQFIFPWPLFIILALGKIGEQMQSCKGGMYVEEFPELTKKRTKKADELWEENGGERIRWYNVCTLICTDPKLAWQYFCTLGSTKCIIKMNSPSVGKNVEKLELLCIVGGNVKRCSHCGKWSSGSLSSQNMGTSLVVQWLRLCIINAGGPSSILCQGNRSHAATNSLHATTKTQHSQINK